MSEEIISATTQNSTLQERKSEALKKYDKLLYEFNTRANKYKKRYKHLTILSIFFGASVTVLVVL